MKRACENRFHQLYLIKINKINIFVIAKVEEINAPLYRTFQSLSRKKIQSAFLASEHRGRDPTWFSVCCWEKMQDLTLAPVMSG